MDDDSEVGLRRGTTDEGGRARPTEEGPAETSVLHFVVEALPLL
jgi:hypothetical protein